MSATEGSRIKTMWMFAMFDLPTVLPAEKRESAKFRKALLRRGFMMMQFSVYARYCDNRENTRTIYRYIKACLPPKGQVRVLSVTDKQFSDMKTYENTKITENDEKPEQLLLL